jgi:hypothetical protein
MAAASAFPFSFSPTIQVEAASLGGLSSLSVRSDVRGATVWLDYQVRGSVPLDMTGLAPGSHLLVLMKEGYYDTAIMLSLAADTKTTVTAALELRTGFLDVRTDPSRAMVIIDGETRAPGVIEVAAGRRDIVVRAFGYRDQPYSVYVPEKGYASLVATLEKAPFEASDFSLSRKRFNPRNAGLRGQVRISFSVTAPGYADVSIVGPDGSELEDFELGPFDDWDQSFTWAGLAEDWQPLPDGSYAMAVSLRPAEGVEALRDDYRFAADVLVDSAMVLTPSGAFGAIPGSAHAPEALPPAADGLRFDVAGWATGETGGQAESGGGALSASLSVEGKFDAGLGVELGTDGMSAVRLGLRVSAPLAAPFGLAVAADGRITDGAAFNPAWARVGPVLGLGSPFLNVVAMPRVGAYWEDGMSARAGLGAAVNVGSYSLAASLSAAVETGPLSQGLEVAWPALTSIELRAAPPGLPVAFRISGGLDWSPEPSAWKFGIGLTAVF